MADFSVTTTVPVAAPAVREINVSGGMTIHYAEEIKTAMETALADSQEVCLDLEKVTEIDLVGMQLICATHRTAMAEQKHFTVRGNEALFNSAANAGGFVRHIGCRHDVDQSCVWHGGAN